MIAQNALRVARLLGSPKEPTDGQKRAGNYKKGHVVVQGLDISIENPKGSTRRGADSDGHKWSCVLPADYGYIRRTEGADGDHVDAYLGPDPESRQVFVINQNDHRTGRFDEHKCFIGYDSEREAVKDYCAAFSDKKGPHRIGSVESMSMDAFKHWLKNGDTTKRARSKNIVDCALEKLVSARR